MRETGLVEAGGLRLDVTIHVEVPRKNNQVRVFSDRARHNYRSDENWWWWRQLGRRLVLGSKTETKIDCANESCNEREFPELAPVFLEHKEHNAEQRED